MKLFLKFGCLFFAALVLNQLPAREINHSPKPSPVDTIPQLKFSGFVDFKLDNGLTVIVVEDNASPTVTVELFVDRPIVSEREYAGTATVMGQMLRYGTNSRSKQVLDNALGLIDGSLSTSDHGAIASGPSQHAEALIGIMADCVLNPAFFEEDLQQLVKQNESALAQRKNDPERIAAVIGNQLRYGSSHPFGERMTAKSLAAITTTICRNFYKRYFRPRVSYLVFSGNISPKEARVLAENYFGDWKAEGQLLAEFFDTPGLPNSTVVDFVTLPGASQSTINVTYALKLRPGSPDALKALLLNQILGGDKNGRMARNLVADKAYARNAYTILEANPNIGYFTATTKVRKAVTDSAVQEILFEMEEIRTHLVSQNELQEAKSQILLAFEQSLTEPGTMARLALNSKRHKLPKNYYADFQENLAKVSAAELLEVAQEYILPSRAHILVVGDNSIADNLKRFTTTGQIRYYSPDGNQQKMVGVLIQEGLTPEQVMTNYVNAIGGQERILEISDMTTVMEGEVQGLMMSMTHEKKMGQKMRLTVKTSDLIVNETIVSGTAAKVLQMGTEQEVNEAALADLRAQTYIFPEANAVALGYQLTLDGSAVVNGRNVYVLNIVMPEGKKMTEYFDIATGLKVRTATHSDGKTIMVDYSEYREVDGMVCPFKITTHGLLPTAMVFEVKSITFNSGLKDEYFEVE